MFIKVFNAVLGVMLMLGSAASHAQLMDRVLVIVNEDVITQSEFDHRLQTVTADLRQNGVSELPPNLPKQLLEGMVSDKLQIQEANRRGIEVTDEELNQALARFAQQQQLTLEQMAGNFARDGQSFKRFGETVRDSLTISRLTDYYAQARVVVPDYEIDGFIAQNNLGEISSEYLIAHILIKDPLLKRELAQQVREEIASGLSFQQAILNYSEATDAQDGGLIGWRTLAQLPEVFQAGIKDLQVGEVSEVLESPNGLHILKLMEMKGDRMEVVQSEVRHILITASGQVARSQAVKRLFEIRQRIVDGEDFEQMARIYSDDSVSAATGGNMGWVSPGETVEPFEKVFTQIPLGEVSQPFSTRYGVHILQVLNRRDKNITDQMVRARADNILRRQRAEREFQQWIRELREEAYIEYVAAPV
ncbi:MAG: peptidylprolyl isomerase [Arenicella sp.]|nr:peptidylprolyl isomerase [Arenicella sp.]